MPILPWIAHLYTATGGVIALLATAMVFAHNSRAAFLYLTELGPTSSSGPRGP